MVSPSQTKAIYLKRVDTFTAHAGKLESKGGRIERSAQIPLIRFIYIQRFCLIFPRQINSKGKSVSSKPYPIRKNIPPHLSYFDEVSASHVESAANSDSWPEIIKKSEQPQPCECAGDTVLSMKVKISSGSPHFLNSPVNSTLETVSEGTSLLEIAKEADLRTCSPDLATNCVLFGLALQKQPTSLDIDSFPTPPPSLGPAAADRHPPSDDPFHDDWPFWNRAAAAAPF